MKKMSINQDLNKRQFEKYQTDLNKPQQVESQQEDLPIEAPTHQKSGYRQYIAPYLSEFEKIQEQGMKNSKLNNMKQTQAVDFGKMNEQFKTDTPGNNEKLDKIDSFFENKAQVAKSITPNQPPFHDIAKPAPQQHMAQATLWSDSQKQLLAEQKAKTGPSSVMSHINEAQATAQIVSKVDPKVSTAQASTHEQQKYQDVVIKPATKMIEVSAKPAQKPKDVKNTKQNLA